jgi:hypothetical protein
MRAELDRPHYEITFSSSLVAIKAELALRQSPGTQLVTRDDATIRYVVLGQEAVGSALGQLDSLLLDVVSVNQVKVPLRDLLAEMYGVAGGEE